MEPRGSYLSRGSTRLVYTYTDKYVIKVPHTYGYHPEFAQVSNDKEAWDFAKWGRKADPIYGIVRAWCKLLANGWLLMEAVTPLDRWTEELPDWASCVDCKQVGRARDGVIVAFDYGI